MGSLPIILICSNIKRRKGGHIQRPPFLFASAGLFDSYIIPIYSTSKYLNSNYGSKHNSIAKETIQQL